MTNLDKNPAIAGPQIWNRRASSSETSCSPAPRPSSSSRPAYLIACALFVCSCATDKQPSSDARTLDATACGAAPSRPGVTVAFDGQGNATMSVSTWQAIDAYMEAAASWITCRQMQP